MRVSWKLRWCYENFKWSKREIQGEVWWTINLFKVSSIHQEEKAFFFPRNIPDTSCPCEIFENATWMVKTTQKEKKGYPRTIHDPAEKCSCDSSNANWISNRCSECSLTKILSGWDEASSSESNTEGSSIDEGSDEITLT